MTYYAGSLWSETNCNETKWFWIIDEIDDDYLDQPEITIKSGIEDSKEKAVEEIKKYIPDWRH